VIRDTLNSKTKKGNMLSFIVALLAISHAFNKIILDTEKPLEILKEYLQEKKPTSSKIKFRELRPVLLKSKEDTLNNIARTIIKTYFHS
jgi:hypothetical protein